MNSFRLETALFIFFKLTMFKVKSNCFIWLEGKKSKCYKSSRKKREPAKSNCFKGWKKPNLICFPFMQCNRGQEADKAERENYNQFEPL